MSHITTDSIKSESAPMDSPWAHLDEINSIHMEREREYRERPRVFRCDIQTCTNHEMLTLSIAEQEGWYHSPNVQLCPRHNQ